MQALLTRIAASVGSMIVASGTFLIGTSTAFYMMVARVRSR
jgi:hypothetical protein